MNDGLAAYLTQCLTHSERMRQALVINRSDSKCGNCRGSADPDEKRHDTKLGYGDTNGEPGCHAYWRYVTSGYAGMNERLLEMRPDLELLEYPTIEPVTPPNLTENENE